MLESVAEATPLPCCVFQCDTNAAIFRRGNRFIQSLGDALQSGLFSRAEMRARMQYEKRKSKGLREIEFLRE